MSTEKQQSIRTGVAENTGEQHEYLIGLVEPHLDTPAEAYATVEDGDHAFVVAAWRADDAVIRSVRFGSRLHDEAVTQIGIRNTHHVDESIETAVWSRQFLRGREERALEVARAQINWEERPSKRPFDGPFFGAGF